jgi:hypothetical protein
MMDYFKSKAAVERYENALTFIKTKCQDGTNSREDTIYALHGLAMDVSADMNLSQADAFILNDVITDSIENIGITDVERNVVVTDVISRVLKLVT